MLGLCGRSARTSCYALCLEPAGVFQRTVGGEPVGAAIRFVLAQQISHVGPVAPALWLRRFRWVPHVKHVRRGKNGSDSHARGTESIGQIIVLASPADEALIEAVDALQVDAPEGDIRTG